MDPSLSMEPGSLTRTPPKDLLSMGTPNAEGAASQVQKDLFQLRDNKEWEEQIGVFKQFLFWGVCVCSFDAVIVHCVT